ncbi:MAG: hypothetical protein AB8G23_07140 [Myxococcota bacterium]
MSKLWTIQFEDGRKSAPRGLRIGRGVFSLCLALGLLVSAASAWAAEVVEVRVGRHPEFTRLVFELDRAAGYRIKRTHAGADSELEISLEATSIPRNLRSSQTLIERVDLTPSGSRSVARIKLTEDGFRLKEMILSSPPRIVLDLVKERSIAKSPAPSNVTTKTATNEKAAPKKSSASSSSRAEIEAQRSAAAAEKRAADKRAAEQRLAEKKQAAEKRASELAAKAEAAAEEKRAELARVAEAAKAKAAQAEAKAKEVAAATAAAAKAKADAAAKATADAVAKTAEKSRELAENASAGASAAVENAAAAAKRAPAPNVARTEPKPKTPRPMVAKKETEDDQGWMTWALMAAGALVVGGAGLLFARRRGGSEEVDFSEDEDEVDFGDDAVTGVASEEDENPFADLSGANDAVSASAEDATTVMPFGEEAATTPFADDDGMDGEATTIVPIPDDEKESETVLFEGAEENENMDDMEVISRDQVNESLGDAAMPPMGGVPEEFQQMMREMNSRMQALEGRCDELVDARDRLERQVAAQTEELRVQRAAIARTQRAVRNLARPEDAGEDEPTEPALRDPNQ